MTTHDLKTWPVYWDAIADGRKTFEVRRNDDRGFNAGDEVLLRNYDPEKGAYVSPRYPSGRSSIATDARTIRARVSYVLSGMGLDPGFVAFGLHDVEVLP